MNWRTAEEKPEADYWCLLHVIDARNAFHWNAPIVGAWTGTDWDIRQYLPDMEGGSFRCAPAGNNLVVVEWCVINGTKTREQIREMTEQE